MANEMVPAGGTGSVIDYAALGVTPSQFADDSTFALVASAAGYLPRLQLFGGNSDFAKKGKINMAHWGLVRGKEDLEDMSKECAIIVLDWRPKALEITAETILSVYDQKSTEFKRIAEKSEIKDSGCMFGPEFLVIVPESKIQPCFATLFMSSKTARREAPNIKARMGQAAMLKQQLIETKKYSWHGPVVTPCSQEFELPPSVEIAEQITKFRNPPASEVEAAPDVPTRPQ